VTGGIILLAALANNPDVQRRGQEEVDSVVGLDRLPVVEDRDSMPYVHAIVKEVQRWYTTVPLGTLWSRFKFCKSES
jgi:cytochrome P450